MKRKKLTIILVGISIYIALTLVEIYYLYALQGDNISNYFNEFWTWHKTLFI